MPSVDGWEDVISNPTISYDDFLNVDDDVAVCGEITDADIIAEVLNHNIEKQDGDEASGDEDESSVAGEMNVPSAAEATNYIMQLRRFFESKNDVSPSIFHSLKIARYLYRDNWWRSWNIPSTPKPLEEAEDYKD
ncbi:TIGD4 [Cordylochernes scorpioides]|uniref:TIGD4 n=1 Tax=Cordylochernes scorpioides TaxID=51811 RepID=A0ABY6LLK2_9ARAC|nr:TIGD4 [Cordylochernes scorpioides]